MATVAREKFPPQAKFLPEHYVPWTGSTEGLVAPVIVSKIVEFREYYCRKARGR